MIHRYPPHEEKEKPERIMKLKSVGIKDIKFPVSIREKNGTLQETVASVNLHADIPRHYRESCISTIMTVLRKHQDEMSVDILVKLLSEVQRELKADAAHIEMTFPYFIEKMAPVSRTVSLMEYPCRFTGSVGYLYANPRDAALFGLDAIADQLVPNGGNIAVAGKFGDTAYVAEYYNFGAQASYERPAATRAFDERDSETGYWARMTPVPAAGGSREKLILEGRTELFEWNLTVSQDWPALSASDDLFVPVQGDLIQDSLYALFNPFILGSQYRRQAVKCFTDLWIVSVF